MTLSIAFYVCMLIYLILGIWASYPFTRASGGSLLLFLLLLILGWAQFGAPIKG